MTEPVNHQLVPIGAVEDVPQPPGVRCPYVVLGVPRAASPAEVARAYRRLAGKHHPDRNPGDRHAEARFKEVQAAWEVLRDPTVRAEYDRTGVRPGAAHNPLTEVAAILRKAFGEVLVDMARGGRNVKQEDLVGHMRAKLTGYTREVQAALDSFIKLTEVLTPTTDRFVTSDPDNVMAGIARERLKELKDQQRMAQQELKKLERCKTVLSTYVYRMDPGSTATWGGTTFELSGQYTTFFLPENKAKKPGGK